MNKASELSGPHSSHKSLQFVSLCEYALFRNCFGVYRHYANQLWSFQLKVKNVFGSMLQMIAGRVDHRVLH